MRKQTSSMDGFVPRRPAGSSGIGNARPLQPMSSNRPSLAVPKEEVGVEKTRPITRSEIDESLASIHDEETTKPKRRLFRRGAKKPRTRKQRIIRRAIAIILILFVLIVGFIAIRAFIASSQVFSGNIFDIFQSKPLKMDANGRSNVLVFGTSEDDPGHQAASLTDSIMVISIDQAKKNAYMISLPRDLYVDYGEACVAGYQGKINALYECYSDSGKNEPAGAKALKKKAGEILGLDIQYYAHVNYTVVRDVVKALDGIEVTIESRDPRGVMDSNFDWKCKGGKTYASYQTILKNCPPSGHFIDYPNGKVKLDAEHALYLAQARGSQAPTYGLEQSNFDREKNQQKIVKAIREKAASAGTLTDVGKVTGLIDALGKNLRTNFETSEVRTLMELGRTIPSDDIQSISLVKEGEELMATGMGGVVPTAGTYEYGQIQAYIDKNLSSDPVVREGASIVVLNGTQAAGLAQTESDALTADGYTVSGTGNAPTTDYTKATIWRINQKGMSGTAKALAKRYNVKLLTATPDFAVAPGTDFVIIVGKASSGQSE